MKKIAVLTSGGDAPGMNAAVRAVVRKAIHEEIKVLGVERGFSGLVNGETRVMGARSVADTIHRGGTVLKTARSQDFLESSIQDKVADFLRQEKVEGIIVIGGDGSFKGARELEIRGIPAVGIPGTIDNDVPLSDTSIGYDTAINTVTDAINRLRDTATSHERVYVVEVMGKENGKIGLMAGLAGGAESILVPEVPCDLEEVCSRILRGVERGKEHSIIVVAEGAASAIEVGREVQEKTGMETRVTILGHLQRGGTPTARDRILASRMGAMAVELLDGGFGGGAICAQGEKLVQYEYEKVFNSGIKFREDIYNLSKELSI